MKALNEIERTTVIEKYVKGKQWWQVAAIVRCSESTAKRYRRSAIKRLIIGIFGEGED